jgi:hypothetical protein
MRQTELNRAVARATGETVERVQRMGFSLLRTPAAAPPRTPEAPDAAQAHPPPAGAAPDPSRREERPARCRRLPGGAGAEKTPSPGERP